MAITDTKLRALRPRGALYRVADSGGLCIEISPTGTKLWRYRYRFAGKATMLALGPYPEVSLADARMRRDEARTLLTKGTNPSEARKTAKAVERANTAHRFEAVAREWLADKSIAASYMEKIVARFEADVFPYIGDKPIASITRADLLTLLKRIEERGAIETAHRARGEIGQVFRFAMRDDRAQADPTPALRGALKAPEQVHFPAIIDPKPLGELLRAMHTYSGDVVTRAALRLAPMLFVRPGELRMAQWSDLDLDAAEWRYMTSKTGTAHLVPLATQAVAILRDLRPLTSRSRFVFPGVRSATRAMSENTVNAALRRLGYPVGTVTGHGFRATARTLLAELGWKTDAIERQLAHKASGPLRGAYDRAQFLAERRRMMQAWADYLDRLREGGNVVAGNFGRVA